MAKRRRVRWDRVFVVFGPLLLLILILSFSCHHRETDDSGSDQPIVTNQSVESSMAAETSPDAVPAAVQNTAEMTAARLISQPRKTLIRTSTSASKKMII